MNKILIISLLTVSSGPLMAQSRAALEGNHNLNDRFALMKEKAETFNDYKVIKNVILDGVWKIAMDSLQKERSALKTANNTIAQLKSEIGNAEEKVKKADALVASSDYERTHLSVFGWLVGKSFFVVMMLLLVGGLLVGLVTIFGSLKILRKSTREKDLTIFGLTSEFDEFRKKALVKEMKISRELQDERNKLAAMMKA